MPTFLNYHPSSGTYRKTILALYFSSLFISSLKCPPLPQCQCHLSLTKVSNHFAPNLAYGPPPRLCPTAKYTAKVKRLCRCGTCATVTTVLRCASWGTDALRWDIMSKIGHFDKNIFYSTRRLPVSMLCDKWDRGGREGGRL